MRRENSQSRNTAMMDRHYFGRDLRYFFSGFASPYRRTGSISAVASLSLPLPLCPVCVSNCRSCPSLILKASTNRAIRFALFCTRPWPRRRSRHRICSRATFSGGGRDEGRKGYYGVTPTRQSNHMPRVALSRVTSLIPGVGLVMIPSPFPRPMI